MNTVVDNSKLVRFLKKIGIEPKNIGLYARAFTHISSASSQDENYETLEFLGDSVIGMVVSEYLFKKFSGKNEGELSRIKALVVSSETLGAKAEELGFEKLMNVATAQVRGGGEIEFSILADCFEAFVGAIFADRGYRKAKAFIIGQLREKCDELRDMVGPSDYKSRLQELWQDRFKKTPKYEVIIESGPDHAKEFTVEVSFGGKVLGEGSGSSKKRAEQEAAKVALERESKRKRGKRG